MMSKLKQFVYQYDAELRRVPLARWQRILCLEQSEPAFRNCTIRIIYAYVEMANVKPVYCHRIEAARYAFDEAGNCIPVGHATARVIQQNYQALNLILTNPTRGYRAKLA